MVSVHAANSLGVLIVDNFDGGQEAQPQANIPRIAVADFFP
jgi:hypothetical protein